MQFIKNQVAEIFYLTDEFCKEFSTYFEKHLTGNAPKKKPKMSESKIIPLLVLFYFGGFRKLNHFYLFYVKQHLKQGFPNTVSYNRFVELTHKVYMPMTLFLKICCLGECTGISFVDPTPIRICKNKRITKQDF